MTNVQLMALVSLSGIILLLSIGFYDLYKYLFRELPQKWEKEAAVEAEREKAVKKLIVHMLNNPKDEDFLGKNFPVYQRKTIARNGELYNLRIYRDLFNLYYLTYIYDHNDNRLKNISYCKRDSDKGKQIRELLEE